MEKHSEISSPMNGELQDTNERIGVGTDSESEEGSQALSKEMDEPRTTSEHGGGNDGMSKELEEPQVGYPSIKH